MNTKIIMLSESLDLKCTYSIISFIYTSRKCKLTYSEVTDYKVTKGQEEILGVMSMFIILIALMVL